MKSTCSNLRMEQHNSKMDLYISWCFQRRSIFYYMTRRIWNISNEGSALCRVIRLFNIHKWQHLKILEMPEGPSNRLITASPLKLRSVDHYHRANISLSKYLLASISKITRLLWCDVFFVCLLLYICYIQLLLSRAMQYYYITNRVMMRSVVIICEIWNSAVEKHDFLSTICNAATNLKCFKVNPLRSINKNRQYKTKQYLPQNSC